MEWGAIDPGISFVEIHLGGATRRVLRVRALFDVDCHIFPGQFVVVKIRSSVIFLLSALVSG